jgi:hypothetical protein
MDEIGHIQGHRARSTTAIEYGEARSKVRQHKRTLPRERSLFELIDDQR